MDTNLMDIINNSSSNHRRRRIKGIRVKDIRHLIHHIKMDIHHIITNNTVNINQVTMHIKLIHNINHNNTTNQITTCNGTSLLLD